MKKPKEKGILVDSKQACAVTGTLFNESGKLFESALDLEKLSKLSKVNLTQLEEILKIKLETDFPSDDSDSMELYSEILDMIQGINIVHAVIGNKAEQLIAVSRNIDEIASQIDDYFNLSETDKYTLPS